jgi:hypothetical protein
MRRSAFFSALLAALLALPAVAALPSVPIAAAVPPVGGIAGAAVAALSSPGLAASHLPDPGLSLGILPLAARVAYPAAAPDALAPLRAGPILEVGAGPHAALAQHMIAQLGFSPEHVHAVDPRLLDESHPAVAPGNFRRVAAEDLAEQWNGRFRNVITFFTFNPEIVDGSTPGMGRGIDVARAAERMAAVLQPGGRLLVVTGGANGLDESAEAAFREHLFPVARFSTGIHVFEKP